MANLIYRQTATPPTPAATIAKGAPLTNLEVDGNFKSVDNDVQTRALKAGDTFTGKVTFAASTTAYASIRIQVGVNPTTPVDGDIWLTNSGSISYRYGTSTNILATQGDAIAFAIALG